MEKILFISGIIFFIIHRYLLKKQKIKDAILTAENILIKVKSIGGILNKRDLSHSTYYLYLTKLNYETEVILKRVGKHDLLNEIHYALAYFYCCSNCNQVFDVLNLEYNHKDSTNTYLVNGRYTKDGDLDQRYNTEFRSKTTHYFDVDCNQCGKKNNFKLDELDYKNRNDLMQLVRNYN